MASHHKLTADRAREVLHYDPDTGVLTWIKRLSNRGLVGRPAGKFNKDVGYFYITIDGEQHPAHRVIWLMVKGRWPDPKVDHRDNDGTNNRWLNLREATNAQNAQNCRLSVKNTSGLKGVNFHKGTQKWRAEIRDRGQKKHLGLFGTKEAAKAAYDAAAKKLHGDFARSV